MIRSLDIAIALLLAYFLIFGTYYLSKPKMHTKIGIVVFVFILGTHLFSLKSSILDIVLYNRRWLIIMIIFPLRNISGKELNAIFRFLIKITTVQCCIYILQYVFQYHILFWLTSVETITGQTRFTGRPVLLYLVIYYLLKEHKTTSTITLLINGVALVLTGSLGLILAVTTAVIVLNANFRSFLGLAMAVGLVIAIVSKLDVLGLRTKFDYGLEEYSNVGIMDYRYFHNSSSGVFRLMLLKERVDYINDVRVIDRLTGLTFRSDQKLTEELFILGTPSPNLVLRREQYDSADIAYAGMLMRFGFLGLLQLIFLCFSFLSSLFRLREVLAVFFLILIYSFTSSIFYLNPFFIIAFYFVKIQYGRSFSVEN